MICRIERTDNVTLYQVKAYFHPYMISKHLIIDHHLRVNFIFKTPIKNFHLTLTEYMIYENIAEKSVSVKVITDNCTSPRHHTIHHMLGTAGRSSTPVRGHLHHISIRTADADEALVLVPSKCGELRRGAPLCK